jgi:hypothetical protein
MAVVLPLFSGSASGTGSAYEVLTGRRIGYSVFASGGSIGLASLEGSFDGSNWFSLDGGISQASYEETDAVVRFVRAIYDDQSHVGTAAVQAIQSDEDG